MKALKKLRIFLVKHLEKALEKIRIKEIQEATYSSLSPTTTIDKDSTYYKALKWAFENRKSKDIQNLAVTGPYGSGKSTVIRSFEASYDNKEFIPLQISLASFGNEMLDHKESDNNDNDENKDNKEKIKSSTKAKDATLRNIETSILQQIFFYEKDHKIPDSRFKKIRHRTRLWQLGTTLFIFTFILAIITVVDQAWIANLFRINSFISSHTKTIHYISLSILLLGLLVFLYKGSRFLWSISIEKFKIKNVKFTVGEKENKSILNHHLDEIIYFFSVRPYNVVIIEDLDRFQQTEIFIKLREINHLLNKSKVLNGKHILFIYAVRDDMFKDVERTKFFDFVLPIIPVINSSNSGEKLRTWIKDNSIKHFTEDFIDGISFFIDDMRLLKNICNEYQIYSSIQDDNLDHQKLFSLLTYKNKYPKDFVDLDRQEGAMYTSITSKKALIKQKIVAIELEIKKCSDRIDYLKEQTQYTLRDLRKIYIAHTYARMSKFHSFSYGGKNLSIDQLATDEYWDKFQLDAIQFNQYYGYNSSTHTVNVPFLFNEIQDAVDTDRTFDEKYDSLVSIRNGEIESLQARIKDLREQKESISRYPIAKLLNTHRELALPSSKSLDDVFVQYVIANNLISEDYSYYTSLFHGESITRSDHEFILNVRQGKINEYDTNLIKVDNVIGKLSEYYFESESILNVALLDALIANEDVYKSKLERLFLLLTRDTSIAFVSKYRKEGSYNQQFIERLTKNHNSLFSSLSESKLISDEEVEDFVIDVISYVETDDMSDLNVEFLKEYVESHPSLVAQTRNENITKVVLKSLGVKIQQIDFNGYSSDLKKTIYSDDLYEINEHNIGIILRDFGGRLDNSYGRLTLTAISRSNAEKLKEYVERELRTYITDVYLKQSSVANDDEEDVITMLSSSKTNSKIEEQILNLWTGKLSNIRNTGVTTTPNFLLNNFKVKPTGSNILSSFDDQLDRDMLENFLNAEENYKNLAKTVLSNSLLTEYGDEVNEILAIRSLSKVSMESLLASMTHIEFGEKINRLSPEWLNIVISSKKLTPSEEHFIALSELDGSFHVELFLLFEKDLKEVSVDEYFDTNDLYKLLNSQELSIYSKATRIKNFEDNQAILNNSRVASLATQVMLAVPTVYTDSTLAKNLMVSTSISIDTRIQLFCHFIKSKADIDISNYLLALEGEYEGIASKAKRPKIPINKSNFNLLTKLNNLDYISSFSEKPGGVFSDPHYRVNLKKK